MKTYRSFRVAIDNEIQGLLDRHHLVRPNNWQSIDVSKLKEAETFEVLNVSFTVPLGTSDLEVWRKDIQPNTPWADRHFELERVSGEPINPGETWKEWPWALSADKFRTEGELFSHSYAERYWCTRAGPQALIPQLKAEMMGIRYPYGDLDDVVTRLIKDPMTRQAVLAVWFPEDQFNGGQRVPCSLFYHFIHRSGFVHVVYTIRSCDALRHFRDDIYLSVRLLLWVIDRLRTIDPDVWGNIMPGFFTMHITSLHCFVGDRSHLEKSIWK